jgi:hypothetical protein
MGRPIEETSRLAQEAQIFIAMSELHQQQQARISSMMVQITTPAPADAHTELVCTAIVSHILDLRLAQSVMISF